MPRNSMTDKNLLARDERDFEVERQRLLGLIERFAAAVRDRTKHPHSLFGPLTPLEWAALMFQASTTTCASFTQKADEPDLNVLFPNVSSRSATSRRPLILK